MVFGWIKGAVERKATAVQRAELQYFIDSLIGASDAEIGCVVAMAAHVRNSVSGNMNLIDPFRSPDVYVPLQLVSYYKKLQKDGLQHIAAGVAVWLHTTRAVHALPNRELARRMWGELSRGIPHVPDAAEDFELLTLTPLNVAGYSQIPIGFEPRDQQAT